jgi:hypothetical protein
MLTRKLMLALTSSVSLSPYSGEPEPSLTWLSRTGRSSSRIPREWEVSQRSTSIVQVTYSRVSTSSSMQLHASTLQRITQRQLIYLRILASLDRQLSAKCYRTTCQRQLSCMRRQTWLHWLLSALRMRVCGSSCCTVCIETRTSSKLRRGKV